jgi:hypothetical protein
MKRAPSLGPFGLTHKTRNMGCAATWGFGKTYLLPYTNPLIGFLTETASFPSRRKEGRKRSTFSMPFEARLGPAIH